MRFPRLNGAGYTTFKIDYFRMKYQVILFRLFLGFIFCLNVFLLFGIRKEREDLENSMLILRSLNDSIDQLNSRHNSWLLNYSITYHYQSLKIDGNHVLFDEKSNRINLLQLSEKGPILIFKYSALNCNVCVDEQISLLKKAAKDIGPGNITILTDYNTERELYQFIRMNQIDLQVFNSRNIELTEIDKSIPYYFILDNSYTLKLLFIPVTGDSLLTQQYFKKITERFFKKSFY